MSRALTEWKLQDTTNSNVLKTTTAQQHKHNSKVQSLSNTNTALNNKKHHNQNTFPNQEPKDITQFLNTVPKVKKHIT